MRYRFLAGVSSLALVCSPAFADHLAPVVPSQLATAPATATNLGAVKGDGSTVTIGTGGALSITATNVMNALGSAPSTSPTTGALVVQGGAGIGGALNVGGNATLSSLTVPSLPFLTASVQGSGNPGTDAVSGNYFWFYNLINNAALSNQTHTMQIQSNENFTGCAAGNTTTACPVNEVSALNVYDIAGANAMIGEDAARFTLDNSLKNPYFGIGVGMYVIARPGAGSTWATIEVNYDYDKSGSPAAGRVGKELDLYGYGADPGNLRVILQLRGGYSLNDQNATGFVPGQTIPYQEIGRALDIGTPTQQGIIKKAILVHGYTDYGIDMSGAILLSGRSGNAITTPGFVLDWLGNITTSTIIASSYVAVGAAGNNITTDANYLYFDSVQAVGFSWRWGTSATQVASLDKNGNLSAGGSFAAPVFTASGANAGVTVTDRPGSGTSVGTLYRQSGITRLFDGPTGADVITASGTAIGLNKPTTISAALTVTGAFTGTGGASIDTNGFEGPHGLTTPAAGAFTTLAMSGSATFANTSTLRWNGTAAGAAGAFTNGTVGSDIVYYSDGVMHFDNYDTGKFDWRTTSFGVEMSLNSAGLTVASVKNTAGQSAPFALTAGAWTSYTPTLSCSSGSLTSATASGRYQVMTDKVANVTFSIKITTVGTCSGTISASLPVSAVNAGSIQFLFGREDAVTGTILQGTVLPNGSTTTIYAATASGTSSSYTPANNWQLDLSGAYESL